MSDLSPQPEQPTSVTLLLRLRDLADHEAWNDFVERYTPRIYAWCRRMQLQENDAADVTQEVLGKLVTAFRLHQYQADQGSFRGWLRTVVNNTVRDLFRRWSGHERAAGDTSTFDRLAAIQDPHAADVLTAELEAEAQREVLREAEHRVRLRVKPATWQAYVLTAVEQQPAAAVASQLGWPIAEVYVAKSRILKLLREEVLKLEGESEAPGE